MEPSASSDITTLLFDLDGTLVRMKRRGLELRFMARAIWRFLGAVPPWRFRRAFWRAADRMQNHGTDLTNYNVFLAELSKHAWSGRDLDAIARRFIERDFARLRDRFEPVAGARETLDLARRLGYRLILATNPVWPLAAVRLRLAWGGLADVPFDFLSHSEAMTRCKPSTEYYVELLGRIGADARECLMIGNDPRKDLPAEKAGIRTILIEDGFDELQEWMKCPSTSA